MKRDVSPYEVLGISRFTAEEDAVKRYKELLKKYHPDNIDTGDQEKFLELQKAWKDLKSRSNSFGLKGTVTHKTVFKFTWR